MTSDVQWQNYLDELTNAVLANQATETVHAGYGITHRDDKAMRDLVGQLHETFITVDPSEAFAARLKDDLMGVERTGMVWRIRRLPARVQWAAIVTAAIGGILIVGQRLLGASQRFRQDDPRTIPDES